MPIYQLREGRTTHTKTMSNKLNINFDGSQFSGPLNRSIEKHDSEFKKSNGNTIKQSSFKVSLGSVDLLQQILDVSPEVIDRAKLSLVASANNVVEAFQDYMLDLCKLNLDKLKSRVNAMNSEYLKAVQSLSSEELVSGKANEMAQKEAGKLNLIFSQLIQEYGHLKSLGVSDDEFKRYLMENYFTKEWLTEEGCRSLLNARIKHSQMIDAFMRKMLNENYDLLGLSNAEAYKLSGELDTEAGKEKLAQILSSPDSLKQFRVGNNYDLRKFGGGWVVMSSNSQLHNQMARLSKYLIRSLRFDCIIMAHGIRTVDFLGNKVRQKTWQIEPVTTPGGKNFNEIAPLLTQLAKEGFKNILIQSCNENNLSIDRFVEKQLPKDVNVTYGGYQTLLDQTIDYDKVFSVVSESVYNEYIKINSDIDFILNSMERNIRRVCAENGLNYDDDVYFENCLRNANDIVINEGIASSVLQGLKTIAKKAVDVVVAIFKLLIKFIRTIWDKISSLFKNSKIVKNINKRLDKPVEVFGIYIEGAKVNKTKASSYSEIQQQILTACKSISNAANRESNKQTKFISVLKSTIDQGQVNNIGNDNKQITKQESGRYRNMPIYSTSTQVLNERDKSNDTKHQGVHLTFDLTPLEDIPKEYYKLAGKLFQTIKDETGKRVGEGPLDAMINAAFSKKTKEDIENNKKKNAFVFIIPRKISLSLFGTPKKWKEFADNVLTKCGFKKGKNDTIATNAYYFYKFSSDKKNIYVAYYIAPSSVMYVASNQLQLSIRCVKNTEHNAFVYEQFITESIEDEIKNTDVERVNMYELGEKEKLGSLFNALEDPDLNNDVDNEIRKYIPYPQLESFFVENFDYTDSTTRRKLMAMTEVEHNSILTNLTSKLYDQIVARTHNIDYGDIPKTKGDITKLSNYETLIDTLGILKGIVQEYKQDTKPIDDISLALANIQTRKDMFERGFRYDCEFPMMMYNTMVMAVVASVSFMITSCIEFIKAPRDESFTIQLDKVAYNKSKDGLLYSNIAKFNKTCHSGDFDKAMNMVIDRRVKKMVGTAAFVGAAIVITLAIISNIVPVFRELTYFYYYSKVKMNDFFTVQADLLTMNAYNLQHNNTLDPDEKSDIVEKQMKIAEGFRKVANKFTIDYKKAEVQATKDSEKSGKKYKVDSNADIVVEPDDDGSDNSILF